VEADVHVEGHHVGSRFAGSYLKEVQMEWVIIKRGRDENAARFQRLANVERDMDLNKGMSLASTFPAGAEVRMNPDFPDDIELVDSLHSNGDLLFVNSRVREFLDHEGLRNLEFLPVNVINHKGKRVKEPYFVINILSRVDCVDMSQSKFELNDIDKVSISAVDVLVIDEARLPTDVKIFRPKRLEQVTLIDRAVADKIQDQGFRGFAFEEVEDYTYP
jgi:hypothetical protein